MRFRNDETGTPDVNGAIPCYTRWMGGPSIALIRNCPTPFGPRTVYVTDHADTCFSLPAECKFRKRTIKGYLTCDDRGWQFHPYKYGNTVYPIVEVES